MIIAALVKRYEQQVKENKIVELGWSIAEVSFALRLYESGEIADFIDLRTEIEGNKKSDLDPIRMEVPEQVRRSSGIASSFLCENAQYFLGIDGKTKQFEAAKKLHLEILKDCNSRASRAIKNFFRNCNPSETATHPILQAYLKELQKGARLIFMFEEIFATEDDEIRTTWENYWQNQGKSPSMQCSITGEISSFIARIHPLIKGVTNAHDSGGSIVSFNESAFESYGHKKEQGLNAPISKYAAFAYTTALNDLLSDKNHVQFFGDMTLVYWAEENNDECQDYLDDLLFPNEDKISNDTLNELMKGIKGKNISFNGTNLDYDNPFYILGLAPNNARLSIRLFLQNSFGEVVKNIAKHYEDFRIIKPKDTADYISLWRILKATVSTKAKDQTPSPLMSGAVVKAVMTGQNYPVSLFQNVILRIRAEHAVTYEKAAIIKAYLTRNKRRENLMSLDENSTDVNYVYGRIFSVLESIQMAANPTLNATIKDKYFTSACATPTKVFPILLKLSVHHLRKLETGRRIYLEKQLTNLMGKLSPSTKNLSTLTLEEQGMFILGYYHQTQERYKKKEDTENG